MQNLPVDTHEGRTDNYVLIAIRGDSFRGRGVSARLTMEPPEISLEASPHLRDLRSNLALSDTTFLINLGNEFSFFLCRHSP